MDKKNTLYCSHKIFNVLLKQFKLLIYILIMLNTEEDVVVKQKRGRKPKNSISTTSPTNENINLVVCETDEVGEIEKHIGKK